MPEELQPAQGAPEVPPDLAELAQEREFPLDLIRRALALGFPPEAVKAQIAAGASPQQAEQFIAQQEQIRSGGEIPIPDELREVAERHSFPLDLVRRSLALGVPAPIVGAQIEAGLRPHQAERFIRGQERVRGDRRPGIRDPSWMHVPTEWGVRVRPGKKGLTLGSLNVGTYGDIPDFWPYHTEMPRGAFPIPGVPSMGYTIYEKAELWADNAADLYEEAIQRRWRPATDIPWESIEPLPEETERAMGQLCTYLCEKALLAADVTSRWLPQMSYGYHEVKVFLATTGFDAARHFEVFRKRALYSGGRLGFQSPGTFHRAVIDARAWTEASILLHLLSDSFLFGLCQLGLYVAHNDAEEKIFRLSLQDVCRRQAYGMMHLKYFLSRKPERREEVHTHLNKGEAILAFDQEQDVPLREAVILLLGGGLSKEQILAGAQKLEQFRRRWVEDYLRRLAAAGLPERRERLHPAFAEDAPQPVAAQAT